MLLKGDGMEKFYCERRVDKLGRIVLPKQVRDSLNLIEGSRLKLTMEQEKIELVKTSPISNSKLIKSFMKMFYNEFQKSIFIVFEGLVVDCYGKYDRFLNCEIYNKDALKIVKNNVFFEKYMLLEGFSVPLTCFKLTSIGDDCVFLMVLDELNSQEELVCKMLIKMLNLED